MRLIAQCTIIGILFISGCGDRDAQKSEAESEPAKIDRMDQLAAAANDMSDKMKACMNEDGEACHWLGDHYAKVHKDQIAKCDELAQSLIRKVKYHYKAGCDAGYQPACTAFETFE